MSRADATVDWDPERYRRFERERTLPALDLLGRVPLRSAGAVIDLGCGPGTSTEILVERFPAAVVTGVDASDAMLASARARLPGSAFVKGDVATWAPPTPPDLVFANAVLQWVPDHRALLPRLFAMLRPAGVLAVQMPANLDEPSHRSMRDVAADGPWREALSRAGQARDGIVLRPEAYYDLLASEAATIDVWRTTYHHVLDSAAAIVDWVRSTGLRPFLAPLAAGQQADFLEAYTARIAQAYPPRHDGMRLFPFPRLFIVATRRDGRRSASQARGITTGEASPWVSAARIPGADRGSARARWRVRPCRSAAAG